HPEILDLAQRGFIRNGCIQQCLNLVLDVFEDRATKQHAGRESKLFTLLYDQRKAFDSVQQYTIEASLRRFNMPDNFIEYVCSGLLNATSCVMTKDGPTQFFDILTSVRQGDPLAPLIYILVVDALHAGYRSNPLYPE